MHACLRARVYVSVWPFAHVCACFGYGQHVELGQQVFRERGSTGEARGGGVGLDGGAGQSMFLFCDWNHHSGYLAGEYL